MSGSTTFRFTSDIFGDLSVNLSLFIEIGCGEGGSLAHVPTGWKLRYAFNVAHQIAVLLYRRHDRRSWVVVQQAVAAGLRGRLGPYRGGVLAP
jgi:hypothetical protein